jgi:hypothetical protein
MSSIPTTGVNLGPVQGRKRGMTRTLLGSQYEETVTSVLDPPTPLQDLSGYTFDRVKEGLKYADTTPRHSKRTISPAGGLALKLYKETCIGLLQMLDVEEGEIFEESAAEREVIADSHRVFIREAEKGMQINAYMRILKTTSAQELQEEILNLQQTAFYGRYGDYFAEICNDLKVAAGKAKVPGWQTLSKAYWSDIARRVDDERPIYEKSRAHKVDGDLQSKMPTTHAIRVACWNIGLDPEDTLEIVKQYGIRNDLLHVNLLPLVKKGSFA